MRKLTIPALLLLLTTCGAAQAQLDVELAFDPAEVYAGDTLHASASVANLGDVDVVADVAITITFDGVPYGPFTGELPLQAGQERGGMAEFTVPAVCWGFSLGIEVTVSAGGYSDTAAATLVVHAEPGGTAGPEAFAPLGVEMVDALLGDQPIAAETSSLGALKRSYR